MEADQPGDEAEGGSSENAVLDVADGGCASSEGPADDRGREGGPGG